MTLVASKSEDFAILDYKLVCMKTSQRVDNLTGSIGFSTLVTIPLLK